MAITKLAEDAVTYCMEKDAIALTALPMGLGAAIGASRANNLTNEEEAALKHKYSLSNLSNLGLRNAGRGAVGAGLGSGLGVGLGAGLGALLGAATGDAEVIPHLAALGGIGGGLTGIGIGMKKMTDRYSRSAAQDAIKEYAAEKSTNAAANDVQNLMAEAQKRYLTNYLSKQQ